MARPLRSAGQACVPDGARARPPHRTALRDRPRETYIGSSKVGRLLVPDEHWRQAAEEALPAPAELRGQGVIGAIGGGMNQSAMLTRFHDHQDASAGLVVRARAIAEVCPAHGTSLPTAAIAFPLAHPDIINSTLGMRSRQQVIQNVELHRRHVRDGLWDDLRAQGLIRADVPAANRPGRSARCL